MTRKTIAATVLAVSALTIAAAPAWAVTVMNNADKAHEVVVDLGEKETKTNIEAGKSAKLDCGANCELRVTGSGYGLAASTGEKAVIGKNGIIAYAEQADKEAKNGAGKSKTMVD